MKNTKKILSVIFSIVMIVSVCPITANANDNQNAYEKVGLIEQNDERTENSKTFYTSNGTYASIITTDAICYEDNGEYKDIDNTIIKKDADTLTNTDNSYTVTLPKKYKSGDSVTISKGNATVSFGLIDDSISSKSKIVNGDDDKAEETSLQDQLYNELDIQKTNSSVIYNNICENTDIEYNILPTSVKENIIINKAPDSGVAFKYSLNTTNSTAVLNDDNSISVISNKKEIFIIPAPYMYDSAENFCDEIDVTLEETNSSEYILTYTPSESWLLDESTEYPVTFDPDIIVEDSSATITDTYVSSLQKSTNYKNSTTLYVQGSLNGSGACRTSYFKINSLPELPDGVMISSATFGVYKLVTGGDEQNNTLTLSSVTDKNNDDAINLVKYNNIDTYFNDDYTELDTEFIGNSVGMMEFNITDKVIEWYNDNDASRYLALHGNESTANYLRFASSENKSAQKPLLTVEYATGSVLSDSAKLHTIDLGYVGTAYINDATGRVNIESYKFDYNDLSCNTTLSMFMGSNIAANNDLNGNVAFNFNESLVLGSNIDDKTTYRQTLADGSQAYYVNTTGNNYYNYVTKESYEIYQQGDSLILKKAPDEDSYSEIKEFLYSNGQLKKYSSKSSTKDTTYTTLNYTKNEDDGSYTLNSITDETSAQYSFDYSDGKLDKIIYTNTEAVKKIKSNSNNDLPTALTIGMGYDDETGKFNSITTSINNYAIDDFNYITTTDNSKSTVNYSFNSNGAPLAVTDENGITTTFEYDNLGRVAEVSQTAADKSNTSPKVLYTYSYDIGKTTITDTRGNTVYEAFNKDGSISNISNANGYSQFVSNLDENMEIKSSEFSRYSRNYIINGDFEAENDNCFGSVGSITDTESYNGTQAYKVTSNATATTGINVDKANSTFTASVWVKGTGATAKLTAINSESSDSENAVLAESNLLECTDEWQQLSCAVNSNSEKYIGLSLETTGTVYIDCVKVENNVLSTDVNSVINGEFSQNLDNWITSSANQTSNSGHAPGCDSGALCLTNSVNGQAYAYQKVSGTFKDGDTFTFGAYSYSAGTLPASPMVDRKVSLSVYASNNGSLSITDLNALNPVSEKVYSGGDTWEYLADEITLDSDCQYLYIVASSMYQKGISYFDGINLVNGKFYVSDYSAEGDSLTECISQDDPTIAPEISLNYNELTTTFNAFSDDENNSQLAVLNSKVSKNNESKQFIDLSIYSKNKDYLKYSSNSLGWVSEYETDIFKNKICKTDAINTDSNDNILEVALYDQYGKIYTSKSGKGNDLYQVFYQYSGSLLKNIFIGEYADSDNQRTVKFNYDSWGNLISSQNILTGDTEYISFDYDLVGNLSKISYPNGNFI